MGVKMYLHSNPCANPFQLDYWNVLYMDLFFNCFRNCLPNRLTINISNFQCGHICGFLNRETEVMDRQDLFTNWRTISDLQKI